MTSQPDYSASFYRDHAKDYAHYWGTELWNIVNASQSHPALTGGEALISRMRDFVPPGAKGLDAGCGPAVTELYHYTRLGYDMTGIDAINENLEVAGRNHPELRERLHFADLREPLAFADASFDFVICSTVIQHIEPEKTKEVTLPEFARVLRPDGMLQLAFKSGRGITTVLDPAYNLERSFHLYDPDETVGLLSELGLELVSDDPETLGGIMHYVDRKGIPTCIVFARKTG